MTVTDGEFSDWLASVGAPTRTSDLSRLLDFPASRIGAQRMRGRVPASNVVAVSRALGIDPVDALAQFTGFDPLAVRMRPTDAELLSQLQAEDVMVEVMKRRRVELSTMLTSYDLLPFPFGESTRHWFDAIDPDGTLRRQVAERTKTDLSHLSKAIGKNALSLRQALAASKVAGVSPTSGLFLSGLLTAQEAGWPIYGRENALLECSDMEIIELLESRTANLRRVAKAADDEKLYFETLG